MSNKITRMVNRGASQKDLKGAIFDECMKMIRELKTWKDRQNVVNALAILLSKPTRDSRRVKR